MAKKENTVKAHIIPRSGKAADWTLVNPVLLAGELGVETDTGRFKFGNGANPWNELPYSGESGGVAGLEIGGRNLLLDSARGESNQNYPFGIYYLSDTDIAEGATVTLTLWGNFDSHLTRIVAYNSNDSNPLFSNSIGQELAKQILETGKGSVTFPWKRFANAATPSTNKTVFLFAAYGGGEQRLNVLYKVKLEYGNIPTDWSPAPADSILTEMPVATEDTVGGFKSNPRGDIGAVEILGDGTAEVDTVRYAESAYQATAANRLVAARTISLSGEASGSVSTTFSGSSTIPVTLNVPAATEDRIGGIQSGPSGAGNVRVDQYGLAYIDSAPKLGTARTIALTGDVTGSTTFDGSKNVTIFTKLNPYVINIQANSIGGDKLPNEGCCIVFIEGIITNLILPENPAKGQIIFLKNITSTAKTTITVGNSAHYINDGKYNKKTSWTFSEGKFFLFIWDQKNLTWQAGYMSGN